MLSNRAELPLRGLQSKGKISKNLRYKLWSQSSVLNPCSEPNTYSKFIASVATLEITGHSNEIPKNGGKGKGKMVFRIYK